MSRKEVVLHFCNAIDNLNDLPIREEWARRWAEKAELLLPTLTIDNWISVDDALPEEDHPHKAYLICAKWIGESAKEFSEVSDGMGEPVVDTARFLYHKKLWIRDFGEEEVYEYHEDLVVTHWQEFPEPKRPNHD